MLPFCSDIDGRGCGCSTDHDCAFWRIVGCAAGGDKAEPSSHTSSIVTEPTEPGTGAGFDVEYTTPKIRVLLCRSDQAVTNFPTVLP